MKKRKNRGIEDLKSRYGLMFITPWLIGMIMFFLMPLVQSVIYSFNEVTVASEGIKLDFAGLQNYKDILFSDVNYTEMLKESMTSFLYSLPIIILLSMSLALILNQKFKGRLFFRALYFLPVIISTGAVMNLIFKTTGSDMSNLGVSESFSSNMISVDDIVKLFDIKGEVAQYITITISKLWSREK